jgi:hypothetical protein
MMGFHYNIIEIIIAMNVNKPEPKDRRSRRAIAIDLETARCASCFSKFTTKNLAGYERGLDPIVCEDCHAVVHRYCQGMATVTHRGQFKSKEY